MAPIHDTDIAEERYSKAQWQYYELWEKIEVKLKRRKWLWIGATVIVFLMLSSIPIMMDRWPKWAARVASRKLAQEINAIKKQAGVDGKAYRIRFAGDGKLNYVIETLPRCATGENAVEVRRGELVPASSQDDFYLLSRAQGEALDIPGLIQSFCYDPLAGSQVSADQLVGFAVIPAKDLGAARSNASSNASVNASGSGTVNPMTARMDRISVLLLHGESAEISFD